MKTYWILFLLTILLFVPHDIKSLSANWANDKKCALVMAGVMVGSSILFFKLWQWWKGVVKTSHKDTTINKINSIVQNEDAPEMKTVTLPQDRPSFNWKELDELRFEGIGEVHLMQVQSEEEEYLSLTALKDDFQDGSLYSVCSTAGYRTLTIGWMVLNPPRPIRCVIALQQLPEKLRLNQLIKAKFITNIKSHHMFAILENETELSCDQNCSIDLSELKLIMRQKSRVTLKGKIDKQNIFLEGKACYDANCVKSNNVEIRQKDSSKACIRLENMDGQAYPSLKCAVYNSSVLSCDGSPKVSKYSKGPKAQIEFVSSH